MKLLLYFSTGSTIIFWLFTLYRVATGRYQGRYTKRRWLLSVGYWGVIGLSLYWMKGERQRMPALNEARRLGVE